MVKKQETVYGYLMDVMAAIKYAIVHVPEYRALIGSKPFLSWQIRVLGYTVSRIGSKAGIPDLESTVVWIGNGLVAPCWELPSRFMPKYLTKEDAQRLHKLKALLPVGVTVEPASLIPCEDEEPEEYRNWNPLPKELAELSLADAIEAFDSDSKAVLKMFSGDVSA